MIEGRSGAGLAEKALPFREVRSEILGQKFEGDSALELLVAGLPMPSSVVRESLADCASFLTA